MRAFLVNHQVWKIILGTSVLACVLGVCVDLVTANVAVDYFAVHHPPIVNSRNPWVLAVIWGIAASWWAGAISGFIIALVNHRRTVPLQTSRLFSWTIIACALIWVIMIGIVVVIISLAGSIPEEIRRPTFEYDRRLVAVAMAHQYEYAFGAIATCVIAILTWRTKSV